MKAMLLAAGKGTRMLPLTAQTPKPLLQVAGRSLIEHQIVKLEAAGFTELVINTAWLGEQLEQALGDGSALGVNIQWSREAEPLETAGGIIRALPLLGARPFAVINADTWTDYPFEKLTNALATDMHAHLVLVPNPPHHPHGDFILKEDGSLKCPKIHVQHALTFSGIAVYHPAMFIGINQVKYPLLPILQRAIRRDLASAEYYDGVWEDIGTPERLDALDKALRA